MQITCVAGAFKGQDTVPVIYEQGLKLREQEIFFFSFVKLSKDPTTRYPGISASFPAVNRWMRSYFAIGVRRVIKPNSRQQVSFSYMIEQKGDNG